jgi:hypothetical protein
VRRELETVLLLARNLPAADLPEFLGQLETIRVTALARITTPTPAAKPDELLSVEQTAQRLHCSPDYLYRHHARLPFARRVGRKLLFSSVGLDAYLKKTR